MIILDTHIWVWWALGEDRLSINEIEKLDIFASNGEIAISAISIWEVEILERKSKLTLMPNFKEWTLNSIKPNVCRVLPIDSQSIIAQRKLPDIFHRDPADRLITATSIHTGFPLVTKDKKMIELACCEIFEL